MYLLFLVCQGDALYKLNPQLESLDYENSQSQIRQADQADEFSERLVRPVP